MSEQIHNLYFTVTGQSLGQLITAAEEKLCEVEVDGVVLRGWYLKVEPSIEVLGEGVRSWLGKVNAHWEMADQ